MKIQNKKVEQFEFSRTELFIISSITLILFVISVYYIFSNINDLTAKQFLLLTLFVFGIFGLAFLFGIFLYSDILIRKTELEVVYLGWYVFGIKLFKQKIKFKDIKKVQQFLNVAPGFGSLVIKNENTSIIIYYGSLKGRFTEFGKTLLSRVPKDCEIIGFKYTKKGELIS